jgi:hypothetical protein
MSSGRDAELVSKLPKLLENIPIQNDTDNFFFNRSNSRASGKAVTQYSSDRIERGLFLSERR